MTIKQEKIPHSVSEKSLIAETESFFKISFAEILKSFLELALTAIPELARGVNKDVMQYKRPLRLSCKNYITIWKPLQPS